MGDEGEARFCYVKMAAGMARLQQIEQNVEHDAVNSEKHTKVCWDMFRVTGAMFEQEQWRFISMFVAAGSGGTEEVTGSPEAS